MSTYEDGWRDCALSLAAEFIKIGAENRDPLTSSAYYHAALVARQLQDGPEAHGSPSPVSLDPGDRTDDLSAEGYEPFIAAEGWREETEIRFVPESAVAAERSRIIAKARELGATYPVTLDPPAGSERAATRTSFPFADYLEDAGP